MYIGNTPTTQAFTFGTDSFDGDGTTLQFTLSRSIPNVYAITVIVNNVPQNPFTNSFSVNSSILTFTEAPSIGTKNVWVFYNSYITQLIQPGYKTVSADQITDNYALWNKSSNNNISYVNGNVGVGTSSPTARLHVSTSSSTQAKFNRDGQTALLTIYQSATDSYVSATNSGASLILATQDTERARIDSSGNLLFNSGYGSVATAYGCRAWVNFNGTGTVAIRASGNVSSITDNGTGNYTVNFTTAMTDSNYVTNSTSRRSNFADPQGIATVMGGSTYASVATTTSVQIATGYTSNGSFVDFDYVGVSIFR